MSTLVRVPRARPLHRRRRSARRASGCSTSRPARPTHVVSLRLEKQQVARARRVPRRHPRRPARRRAARPRDARPRRAGRRRVGRRLARRSPTRRPTTASCSSPRSFVVDEDDDEDDRRRSARRCPTGPPPASASAAARSLAFVRHAGRAGRRRPPAVPALRRADRPRRPRLPPHQLTMADDRRRDASTRSPTSASVDCSSSGELSIARPHAVELERHVPRRASAATATPTPGRLQARPRRAPAVGLPRRALSSARSRPTSWPRRSAGTSCRSRCCATTAPLGEGSLQQFVDADFEQHYFTLYEDERAPRPAPGASACSTCWPTTPTARAATACSAPTATSGASTTGCASTRSSSCAR